MSRQPIALAALVLLASLAPMAAASGATPPQASSNSDVEAYSGSHVSFGTDSSALVGYAVEGETVLSSVEVQSESQVQSDLGLGVSGDLETVTDFAGAGLSMDASAQASANVQVESGATISAHDHSHGTLVVDAEDDQYVSLGLNASSEAQADSDSRVLVTTDSGTKAAVMVVGDGDVAVNDDGNVTANVKAESKLVVRSYSEERTESDEQTEQLIANGTAAAEVYVDQQNGERVNGTITYDQDTDVTVDAESENAVNMTIDRAQSQGKVVIASASQFAAESTDDLTVRVDGDVAAQASSYSELRAAADNGATSKYMVKHSASAQADADVLVAVNHFSERSVSIADADSSSDGGDGSDTNGDDTTNDDTDNGSTGSGDGPGFGVVAALLSMFGLASLLARHGR